MQRRRAFTPVVLTVCVVAATASHVRAQDAETPALPEFYAAEPALRTFVREALEANPALGEAESRYRAALEAVPQITALPDPTVGFTQMVRSVQTRVGPQLNTVMLAQAFPWFGKRELRGRLATGSAGAALETWRARRRDVVAQVKSAFYNLGYVDTAIAVSLDEQSILEHYEQLARDRYTTGSGLQQAVIRVQAELTRILNRLYGLRQQRETLVARLNTLMSRGPESPIDAIRLADPPAEAASLLDLPQLLSTSAANHPEVLAADALIVRGTDAVALAGRNSWPDLTIGGGLINVGRSEAPALAGAPENGRNAWTVSVGVSLPIWRDKLRAGVRQAGFELEAQRARRDGLIDGLQFEVRDQVNRLQTLDEQMRLFRDVLIPQAIEAQRATEAAYETGRLGVLDLLDTERVLLDVRLAHERQKADYLVALGELERAIGIPFPR